MASTIGLALGFSVVGIATFGIFIPALEKAFGWGRGEISLAHTIMSYTMAVAAPLAGAAFDRWGVRRVLLPSIVGLSVIIACLARLDGRIGTFYFLYAILALIGVGTAPAGYMRTISLWFEKDRGLALGIAMAGVGIGTAVIPPMVQTLTAMFDWRAGYLSIAALILLASAPVAWLLLRDPATVESRRRLLESPQSPAENLPGLTLKQAIGGRVFWQMAVAFPLLGVFTSGLMAHLVPLLTDRGVSPAAAAAGMSMLGIAIVVGRVFTGWLLDRIFAPYLVAVCIVVAALGVLLLWSGARGNLAFAAAALLGFAIGAELDFMSYLIGRYFGMAAYARLYGLMYGIFIAGSGLGPLLMGYGYEATDNYDKFLLVILGMLVITIPLFVSLGPYLHFASIEDDRQ